MPRTLGVVWSSSLRALSAVAWLTLLGPGCGNGGSAPPEPECALASECDDDDACTLDTCNEAGECVNDAGAADGEDCDDGLFCTRGDACSAGSCGAGASSPCGGSTPVCSEALDSCSGCTTASECDDDNACTDDACGTDGACTNAADDTNACADDGVFCNGSERCSQGSCSSDAVDPCAGGSLPFCDPEMNLCVECEGAADCDDGVFCNGVERCVSGACEAPLAVACPDAMNGCDEDRGVCLDCNVGTDCDDEDACTLDRCDAGSCAHAGCPSGTSCTAGMCSGCTDAGDCDDGNPCTTDTCSSGTGVCSWPNADNGSPCDDGLFCTAAGATCISGTCLALGGPTCTGNTPICNEEGDSCSACESASDCDDGNACTTDTCNANGSCSRLTMACADDGVACTITHCDRTQGCVSTSVRDTFVGLAFEGDETSLFIRGPERDVLVTSGLFLCAGPATCDAVPGPFPLTSGSTLELPLSVVLSNLPAHSGGELALSTTSDGSEVCDYVRWSDAMSSPPTALGTAAANQGEWTGTFVDTASAPAAPPAPGICWLDVWGGGEGATGNDAPSDWGYCPHCGDCADADPCTYDHCDEATSLCLHDAALTEALAAVDFATNTVSLQNVSTGVDELPALIGLCTAGSMASCELVLGVIPASGRDVSLQQDLLGVGGELAVMVQAGPSTFQICDYVRWSSTTPVSGTTLSALAETADEWTAGAAVSTVAGTRIVHSGVPPNSSVLEWSSEP